MWLPPALDDIIMRRAYLFSPAPGMIVLAQSRRWPYRPASKLCYPESPDDPDGVTSFWGKLFSVKQIDEVIAKACAEISKYEMWAAREQEKEDGDPRTQQIFHEFAFRNRLHINELLLHRKWVIKHLKRKYAVNATKLYYILAASPENNRMLQILGKHLVMHIARVTTFTKYGPPAVCR